MADNSSSLSLLTVLKPGGSSHIGAESKPAKTIDQMIALMSERGLVITDEAELRQVLFDCNYYRLSGYFRSFQVNPAAGDNRYRPGTRDVDFLVPYAMDEKLRNIILKGTAKVELENRIPAGVRRQRLHVYGSRILSGCAQQTRRTVA